MDKPSDIYKSYIRHLVCQITLKLGNILQKRVHMYKNLCSPDVVLTAMGQGLYIFFRTITTLPTQSLSTIFNRTQSNVITNQYK